MTEQTGPQRPIDPSMEVSLSFADLGISDFLLTVLAKLNLSVPTPIQRKAIPIAIAGQDLIGIAQTGTGKTYAFGLPMIERLDKTSGQGLIIAPTRELALQVGDSLQKLGQSFGLKVAVLIGGQPFDRQLAALRRDPQIIVVTPGRLIDHLKRRTFKLDQVDVLVLDEADMMLDMGFAPQIKEILEQMPADHQTMLFSATMPAAIVKIATQYMKLPVSIEVAPPGTTVERVDQEIFVIKNEERLEYLQKILHDHNGSVLVFVRTKHGVKALTNKLKSAGQRATEIHSNLTLNRRRAALDDFRSKKERILVATDVAARGLDINGIELVVNYNLPDSCEDYVHRIGRTGRAGQPGKAISLATPAEQRMIYSIERLINKSIKKTEFAKLYAMPAPRRFGGNRRSGGPRQARRQPFSR
jgi:ATP-dependent RNA helicase RhlE